MKLRVSLQKLFSEDSESRSKIKQYIISKLMPLVLFVLTIYTTAMSGVLLSGNNSEFLASILDGLPYSLAIIIAIGAHPLGHYFVARHHRVGVYTPCFIPTLGLIGTAGAYTRIRWPISDRNALIRIFVWGPILGFVVSWIVLLIGLFYSQINQDIAAKSHVILGNSIVMRLSVFVFFGRLPVDSVLSLHPVAYAGWIGLFYNFCHLLPIGKFDGGRLSYALWGYKVTRRISYMSIGVLMIFGYFFRDWSIWMAIAIIGALSTIGLKKQLQCDKYDQPINKGLLFLVCAVFAILVVSFSPTPFPVLK